MNFLQKINVLHVAIVDFLWVLMAYLRGKVLRQKAYRPRGNFFYAITGTSLKRMIKLMGWWKFRPMTAEEAIKYFICTRATIADTNKILHTTELQWKDGQWDTKYNSFDSGWNNNGGFLTILR